jgi:hypothetical protein
MFSRMMGSQKVWCGHRYSGYPADLMVATLAANDF